MVRVLAFGILLLAVSCSLSAQSFLAELQSERDPLKRSEMAMSFAGESFDNARTSYVKGDIHAGDAELENMTYALNSCVDSLAVMNKARFYKKAELKVAYLQRRLKSLMDELAVQERGWAEYTTRKVEDIHEKMLAGAMRK